MRKKKEYFVRSLGRDFPRAIAEIAWDMKELVKEAKGFVQEARVWMHHNKGKQ